MKRKVFILPLISIVSVFICSIETYANEEKSNTESKSNINILIKERTLYLENVSVPKFNNQKLTGKKLKIKPVNDFKFTVKDKRTHDKSPWKVYYSLSFFLNENDEKIDGQTLTIGKGQVEGLDNESYQSFKVEVDANSLKPMLEVFDSTKTTYNYMVSKNDFTLTLEENVKSGKYVAKQTVILASLPPSN